MRDLGYIIIGILLGLICFFFDGSVIMGQNRGQVMMTKRSQSPRGRHARLGPLCELSWTTPKYSC